MYRLMFLIQAINRFLKYLGIVLDIRELYQMFGGSQVIAVATAASVGSKTGLPIYAVVLIWIFVAIIAAIIWAIVNGRRPYKVRMRKIPHILREMNNTTEKLGLSKKEQKRIIHGKSDNLIVNWLIFVGFPQKEAISMVKQKTPFSGRQQKVIVQ